MPVGRYGDVRAFARHAGATDQHKSSASAPACMEPRTP